MFAEFSPRPETVNVTEIFSEKSPLFSISLMSIPHSLKMFIRSDEPSFSKAKAPSDGPVYAISFSTLAADAGTAASNAEAAIAAAEAEAIILFNFFIFSTSLFYIFLFCCLT